jgi:hypothetical protein
MTHDYKRHGTTTLFAALDVKSGLVIGECLPRHRGREFLRFLRHIERAVLADLDVHVICDNYSTTHQARGIAASIELCRIRPTNNNPTMARCQPIVCLQGEHLRSRFGLKMTSEYYSIKGHRMIGTHCCEAATGVPLKV